MFKKLTFVITLMLFCALSPIKAQTLLENGKNSNDLLITYERGRTKNDKIQINSDGYVFYKNFGTVIKLDGVEVTDSFIITSSNKSKNNQQKKPKASDNSKTIKQEKLTVSQLKELISTFEKIDFFNLQDKYPTIDFSNDSSQQVYCVNPGSVEIISIQIGGTFKKVENDLSCSPRQISLKELTDKIDNFLKIVKTKDLK